MEVMLVSRSEDHKKRGCAILKIRLSHEDRSCWPPDKSITCREVSQPPGLSISLREAVPALRSEYYKQGGHASQWIRISEIE